MATMRYQALGPLLADEGSRAFLGLQIDAKNRASPVVLIWVPDDAASNPEVLDRIRRETMRAASLDHPNIVRVYGFEHLEEGWARIVEFANAESLRKVLQKAGKLAPHLAARVAVDAAMGVHYAHVAGNDDGSPLVHGDVRPETLLVGFNGATKISGYGALNVAPREMGGKRVKGRRIHCAPEQVLGGRDAINRQTDVYLLGLVLYECLTGQIPFENEPDFDQAVLSQPLPPITEHDVPDALREVVARAMAKKASERYATPLAFREAIEASCGALATADEFAQFVAKHFPSSDEVRAARRRALDAGIADFARKQWEQRASAPGLKALAPTPAAPAPPPPAPPPPAAPQVPATAAPAKAAPRAAMPSHPRRGPVDSEPSETNRSHASRRRQTLWMAGALVVVAAVIAWALVREPARPASRFVSSTKKVKPVETPPPLPLAPPDAGTELAIADAGSVPPTSTAAVIPVADAGTNVAAPSTLEIEVHPDVDLTLDGNPIGRSPWSGAATPGRHVVLMSDKDKGINTSRAINVKPEGPTTLRVTLEKGYVSINAPDGANVQIDGNRVGYAPIRGEVPVWEGNHRIVVTVGKAKWQEAFRLNGGQRMYFNVTAQ